VDVVKKSFNTKNLYGGKKNPIFFAKEIGKWKNIR
jgi:hypothetical protein